LEVKEVEKGEVSEEVSDRCESIQHPQVNGLPVIREICIWIPDKSVFDNRSKEEAWDAADHVEQNKKKEPKCYETIERRKWDAKLIQLKLLDFQKE